MLRYRLGLAAALLLVVACAATFFYVAWRNRTAIHDLYDPKILSMRVGGVVVYPRANGPSEVMVGLPVEVACDVVAPGNKEETSHFVVQGPAGAVDVADCRTPLTWTGKAGDQGTFAIEYHVKAADGTDRVVDRREAGVTLVPQREYLRIHALEDPSLNRLETLTVPRSVIPYVDAALRVEGNPDDYAVLFFVRKVDSLSPVLQITVPPDEPSAFKPIKAPLRRFRSWGGDLVGYAAWPGGAEVRKSQPPPPIQVGNQDDTRQAFEIIAGLFRAADLPRVTEACISLKDVAGDRAVFQVKGVELQTIRQLAYKGWMSEPLQVVRAEVAPQASTFEWRVE